VKPTKKAVSPRSRFLRRMGPVVGVALIGLGAAACGSSGTAGTSGGSGVHQNAPTNVAPTTVAPNSGGAGF